VFCGLKIAKLGFNHLVLMMNCVVNPYKATYKAQHSQALSIVMQVSYHPKAQRANYVMHYIDCVSRKIN